MLVVVVPMRTIVSSDPGTANLLVSRAPRQDGCAAWCRVTGPVIDVDNVGTRCRLCVSDLNRSRDEVRRGGVRSGCSDSNFRDDHHDDKRYGCKDHPSPWA